MHRSLRAGGAAPGFAALALAVAPSWAEPSSQLVSGHRVEIVRDAKDQGDVLGERRDRFVVGRRQCL